MKNLSLLIGTIFGTLALVFGVAYFFSSSSPTLSTKQAVDPVTIIGTDGKARHAKGAKFEEPQSATDSAVATESTASAESESAKNDNKITIVEFSDFQCPACKASLPAVNQVLLKYPNDVRLVYRHFPLDGIHPNARFAAEASEAVAMIDPALFWPMHDLIFEKQAEWADIADKKVITEMFTSYAETVGADRQTFLANLEKSEIRDLVQNDVTAATAVGVNATPTFFVNGVATTASELLLVVEKLMKK